MSMPMLVTDPKKNSRADFLKNYLQVDESTRRNQTKMAQDKLNVKRHEKEMKNYYSKAYKDARNPITESSSTSDIKKSLGGMMRTLSYMPGKGVLSANKHLKSQLKSMDKEELLAKHKAYNNRYRII